MTSGELIRTIPAGLGCNADEGAFSPDGTLYVARSLDDERWKTLEWPRGEGSYSFVLCDVASGQALRTFEGKYLVIQVSFSPDGRFIVAGGYDNDVTLWDVASGNLVHTLTGHSDEVHSVVFSPDGTKIVSGSHDMTIRLWDAMSGELIKALGSPARLVTSVAFSADGGKILTGSWDNRLRLWDGLTAQLIRTFEGHSDAVNGVAFSPDGMRLASGSDDTTVKLWDAATGALIATFEDHSHAVYAVAFSPDGRRFVSSSDDKTIKLRDVSSGNLIRTVEGYEGRVNSLVFSSDGRRLLAGALDKTAKLWDAQTGYLLRTFKHEGYFGVSSVAFSPDGQNVLTASGDTIQLWDAESGRLLRKFDHGHTVTSIAITRDFTRLASASGDVLDISSEGTAGIGDKTVKIWDLSNGQLLRTLKGHSGGVKAVAFSPDGARLLSAGQDTTANLWNVHNGELLASIVGAGTDDWLAVTPHGFFNATRNGANLLAIVRNSDVISIDQMRQSLFDPDLVREAIAGDLQGDVREAAKVINLSRILDRGPAPAVAISSHPLVSESADELVRVDAIVSDRGKGIGRIEWRVNGITAAVVSVPPGAEPTRTHTQSLALDQGDNTIEVTAYNASNLLASVPARVTIKFSGQGSRAKAKLYVLSIGINAYPDPGLVHCRRLPIPQVKARRERRCSIRRRNKAGWSRNVPGCRRDGGARRGWIKAEAGGDHRQARDAGRAAGYFHLLCCGAWRLSERSFLSHPARLSGRPR